MADADARNPTPCDVEAKLWRECLKEFDYGPDRSKDACDPQRRKYYSCLKAWTNRTQNEEYSYEKFELTKECSREASKLHDCMMIGMFEVNRCQKEMALLKRCAAKYDPQVRGALEGDRAIQDLDNSVDNSTGLKRLWYKAIGKL